MTDIHTTNNLGYFLSPTAEAEPDRVAIIDLADGDERTVTYGRLDRRLDQVAGALAAAGIARGDRVILSMGNRVEFIEAMFGAMRAGAVPVPVNTRQGADILDTIVDDCGAVGVIAESAANGHVPAIAERRDLALRMILNETRPGWRDYEAALATAPRPQAACSLNDEAICFQSYTSGSTGRPKGVPLTHAGQIWWIDCYTRYWPPSPDARSLVAMPLYHKNAMAGAVKPRLVTGGSMVLMPEFEPRAFLANIERYRCTSLSGVPTVFSLILQESDLLESLDLSSLEVAVVGSAPVHEELMSEMTAKLGCTILQSYGLTEGGPVMLGPPLDGRVPPVGSCGVAWPEGELKLVDADGKTSETFGELWVKNPGVTPGYHNLPDVNRKRIVDGWLRTGDLFRRDADGFFYFQGRTDDMFNCGGENIYPKEVENLIMSHADVVEACVVPVPYKAKGEAPVAMVSLRAGATTSAEALKAYCLANGPAYAHPRRVVIVDELPLSGARKIDRARIAREMASVCADLA